MKRGQTGIGLVILGIVAIIAVIGLVLLFTRASNPAEGASIGNIYGGGQNPDGYGIGQGYQTPVYTPYRNVEYPYAGEASQINKVVYVEGSRLPVFVLVGLGEGGYASIENHPCFDDLIFNGNYREEYFEQVYVPFWTSTGGQGDFPPDSAAQKRPAFGKYGGNGLFYLNSLGAEGFGLDSEELVAEKLIIQAKSGAIGKNTRLQYGYVTVTNGQRTATRLACYEGAEVFPFDQGIKTG